MFQFLSRFFRYKVKEYEAVLLPTPSCRYGGKGEIEISCYSDGSAAFEVSLKHSSVPDGETVEFYCLGSKLETATSRGGYVKKYITFENIADLQSQLLNSQAEIYIGGAVLYTGCFRYD